MSHTTKAACGTVFIHSADFSGDVTVIPVSFPERASTPDGSIQFSVDIPFADLRELVFAYRRDRKIEQVCPRCEGPVELRGKSRTAYCRSCHQFITDGQLGECRARDAVIEQCPACGCELLHPEPIRQDCGAPTGDEEG